MNYENILNHKI